MEFTPETMWLMPGGIMLCSETQPEGAIYHLRDVKIHNTITGKVTMWSGMTFDVEILIPPSSRVKR